MPRCSPHYSRIVEKQSDSSVVHVALAVLYLMHLRAPFTALEVQFRVVVFISGRLLMEKFRVPGAR